MSQLGANAESPQAWAGGRAGETGRRDLRTVRGCCRNRRWQDMRRPARENYSTAPLG